MRLDMDLKAYNQSSVIPSGTEHDLQFLSCHNPDMATAPRWRFRHPGSRLLLSIFMARNVRIWSQSRIAGDIYFSLVIRE